MKDSQRYIGIPNGVVVCVNHKTKHNFSGCYYHAYKKDKTPFQNMEELIKEMDEFFDRLQYPFPATKLRTFRKGTDSSTEKEEAKRGLTKVKSDKELLEEHGEIGTFIVRVSQRQNSTWQGLLTWVEEDKTIPFRSVLELLRLIDEVVEPDEE